VDSQGRHDFAADDIWIAGKRNNATGKAIAALAQGKTPRAEATGPVNYPVQFTSPLPKPAQDGMLSQVVQKVASAIQKLTEQKPSTTNISYQTSRLQGIAQLTEGLL
jgi:hypothetical protein